MNEKNVDLTLKEDYLYSLTKNFCKKLKELRLERHLSQKELADKLSIASSTYANWEQGRREPSIYDILNLISVFKINANDLFDIKIEKK